MTRRRCHRRPGQAQAGNRAARHMAVPHPRVLPPRSRGSTPMPPPLSLEARRAGECYSGCRQGLLAGPNPAASQRVPCQRQCGRVRGGWSRTGGITVGEYRGDRIVFGHRQARQLPGGAPRAHALGAASPSKYLNNRAENSHQPTRHRERAMKRFKSIRHAQRFLSAFSGISPHFRPRRHLLSAADYRQVMADRFAVWNEITGATTTAAA